jgi:hypothetical protein
MDRARLRRLAGRLARCGAATALLLLTACGLPQAVAARLPIGRAGAAYPPAVGREYPELHRAGISLNGSYSVPAPSRIPTTVDNFTRFRLSGAADGRISTRGRSF